MLSKRILGGFAAVLLLSAMALSACGGSSSAGNVKITVWHDWAGSYLTAKKAIFDAYTKAHPNVTFDLINQTDIDTKATTAVKSKSATAPDVILDPVDHVGTLSKAGVIIALDKYLSKDKLESTYTKAAAQGVEYNGQVFGSPEVTEILTIMYNKDLVTADQLPKTTNDMLTFVKNYQTANPGKYGIVWNPTDAYQNAGFYYGFGATYVDDAGTTGVNTAAGVSAATFIGSFAPYLPKDISYDVASTLFTDKKAAAIINGPWAYTDYGKAITNLGFATLPTVSETGKPVSPFTGGKAFMVTKTAKNVDTIADVLNYFSNTENQVAMCLSTGEIPSNIAAGNDASIKANAAINGFVAQAKNGVAFPNTPNMAAVYGPMGDAFKAILAGKSTPAAAMAAADAAIKAAIAANK